MLWIAPAVALIIAVTTNLLQVRLAKDTAARWFDWLALFTNDASATQPSVAVQNHVNDKFFQQIMLDSDRLQLVTALAGALPTIVFFDPVNGEVSGLVGTAFACSMLCAFWLTSFLPADMNERRVLGLRRIFFATIAILVVALLASILLALLVHTGTDSTGTGVLGRK